VNAAERIYRTADGELVNHRHPQAAFLAYAVGDEIAKADESKVPSNEPEPAAQEKARAASPNKSRRPQGNKSGG
jgi:hypothetical protein